MSSDPEMVTLRLFAALRDAVGEREVHLPCAGATVQEMLEQFVDTCAQDVRSFVFDKQGKQWPSLLILINEEPPADRQATRVQPGDVISLLLPLAGG